MIPDLPWYGWLAGWLFFVVLIVLFMRGADSADPPPPVDDRETGALS